MLRSPWQRCFDALRTESTDVDASTVVLAAIACYLPLLGEGLHLTRSLHRRRRSVSSLTLSTSSFDERLAHLLAVREFGHAETIDMVAIRRLMQMQVSDACEVATGHRPEFDLETDAPIVPRTWGEYLRLRVHLRRAYYDGRSVPQPSDELTSHTCSNKSIDDEWVVSLLGYRRMWSEARPAPSASQRRELDLLYASVITEHRRAPPPGSSAAKADANAVEEEEEEDATNSDAGLSDYLRHRRQWEYQVRKEARREQRLKLMYAAPSHEDTDHRAYRLFPLPMLGSQLLEQLRPLRLVFRRRSQCSRELIGDAYSLAEFLAASSINTDPIEGHENGDDPSDIRVRREPKLRQQFLTLDGCVFFHMDELVQWSGWNDEHDYLALHVRSGRDAESVLVRLVSSMRTLMLEHVVQVLFHLALLNPQRWSSNLLVSNPEVAASFVRTGMMEMWMAQRHPTRNAIAATRNRMVLHAQSLSLGADMMSSEMRRLELLQTPLFRLDEDGVEEHFRLLSDGLTGVSLPAPISQLVVRTGDMSTEQLIRFLHVLADAATRRPDHPLPDLLTLILPYPALNFRSDDQALIDSSEILAIVRRIYQCGMTQVVHHRSFPAGAILTLDEQLKDFACSPLPELPPESIDIVEIAATTRMFPARYCCALDMLEWIVHMRERMTKRSRDIEPAWARAAQAAKNVESTLMNDVSTDLLTEARRVTQAPGQRRGGVYSSNIDPLVGQMKYHRFLLQLVERATPELARAVEEEEEELKRERRLIDQAIALAQAQATVPSGPGMEAAPVAADQTSPASGSSDLSSVPSPLVSSLSAAFARLHAACPSLHIECVDEYVSPHAPPSIENWLDQPDIKHYLEVCHRPTSMQEDAEEASALETTRIRFIGHAQFALSDRLLHAYGSRTGGLASLTPAEAARVEELSALAAYVESPTVAIAPSPAPRIADLAEALHGDESLMKLVRAHDETSVPLDRLLANEPTLTVLTAPAAGWTEFEVRMICAILASGVNTHLRVWDWRQIMPGYDITYAPVTSHSRSAVLPSYLPTGPAPVLCRLTPLEAHASCAGRALSELLARFPSSASLAASNRLVSEDLPVGTAIDPTEIVSYPEAMELARLVQCARGHIDSAHTPSDEEKEALEYGLAAYDGEWIEFTQCDCPDPTLRPCIFRATRAVAVGGVFHPFVAEETLAAPDWILPLIARICTTPGIGLREVRMEHFLTHQQMRALDRELMERRSVTADADISLLPRIHVATSTSSELRIDSPQLLVTDGASSHSARVADFAARVAHDSVVEVALLDLLDSSVGVCTPAMPLVEVALDFALLLSQQAPVREFAFGRRLAAPAPIDDLLAPVVVPNRSSSEEDDDPTEWVNWDSPMASDPPAASTSASNSLLTVDSVRHPFTRGLLSCLRQRFVTLLDAALTPEINADAASKREPWPKDLLRLVVEYL